MFPKLELIFRHKKITIVNRAEPGVRRADEKFAVLVTHRRRAVTATARLVKHQRAVFDAQLGNYFFRFVGHENSGNIFHNEFISINSLQINRYQRKFTLRICPKLII